MMTEKTDFSVPPDTSLGTYLTDKCRHCEAEWTYDARTECTCGEKLK